MRREKKKKRLFLPCSERGNTCLVQKTRIQQALEFFFFFFFLKLSVFICIWAGTKKKLFEAKGLTSPPYLSQINVLKTEGILSRLRFSLLDLFQSTSTKTQSNIYRIYSDVSWQFKYDSPQLTLILPSRFSQRAWSPITVLQYLPADLANLQSANECFTDV